MDKLDKKVEEEVLEVVKKYEKDENILLNYRIDDDVITFFVSINKGKMITVDDLQKIGDILEGCFLGMQLVNQEYRFSFNLAKFCVIKE